MTKLTVSKLLLNLLASSGRASIDYVTFFYDMKHHRQAYMAGGHALVMEYQQLQQQRIARAALQQLKRSRYIKAQRIGGRLVVALTTKGVMATLPTQLRQTALRADKLYTVVIFDVPESQNTARRQLRLLLWQGGFTKLQQSVWISKADTYNLVTQFIKQIKLEPWVNVFRARDFLHVPR